ncbi:tRNA glutamyl-Q(34) synthetase GluQRS [Plastorhodobacter daqingensis]|uniref:tRNA glutamyl-Q(34) synthetase GluQRS n=1 Tax=Plastorhodobacter daqingensis TaxID=1387281 RepID=A0ABW2UKG0_9RHOB
MRPDYRTRFAPSPTGLLHLGHAFSALTAWDRAQAVGGSFLLRMEDIDRPRCRPEFEQAIYEDLQWLGLSWPRPFRQSDRMGSYRAALGRLGMSGLIYPCRCTRADIKAALSAPQEGVPVGPDAVIYPGTCRGRGMEEAGPDDALRLDMRRAVASLGNAGFQENGPLYPGWHRLDPDQLVAELGDVVLARRDIGTSYHVAVVVDDAAQRVTEVVRGVDLFSATPIHRLLQVLLELPHPNYWHHDLIRDEHGKRLAKRDDARAIRAYRAEGATPEDIRRMVGL